MERLNDSDVRRRLAIYAGERIPENERNLTDVRNRVSLILEYELARISNSYLKERGEDDIFWAYVVANRFPDLEVRRRTGERGLRVEVKCLQSIAEEKSANFDALKKDLHPGKDFIVVWLWEWAGDPGSVKWEKAPRILRVFAFHAYSLAQMRDHYWLNTPPNRPGRKFQGFDLRHGISYDSKGYKEEEGNYGKLTRIWDKTFEFPITTNALIEDTMKEYEGFKEAVVSEGFEALCARYLPFLAETGQIIPLVSGGKEVGKALGPVGFVRTAYVDQDIVANLFEQFGLTRIVCFSEKYKWTAKGLEGGRPKNLATGKKPKHLSRPALLLIGS